MGRERHLPGRTAFQNAAQNQAGLVQIMALPILIHDLGQRLKVFICKVRIIMLLPRAVERTTHMKYLAHRRKF